MSQLKKGAILSYINILVTNIVGLLLTPFIVKSLGDSEYGLYTLVGSFIAYFSLMDLGLNNTVIRFVAKYRTQKDKKGEENFLATIMLIYFAIALLIVALGIIMYFNLTSIYGESLSPSELHKAKIMFVILIFNVAITIPGGAFIAISSGYERFVFPRMTILIKYIVRSLLLVLLLSLGGDAVSIVVLDTVVNVLFIAINGVFVLGNLKVKIRLHSLNKELLSEVFSYSTWIFVLAIIAQFQWQSGQLVLGALKGTTVVAIYAVGVMLGTYYGAFASAFSSLLLPKATKMLYNNSSHEEINNMFIRIGRITLMILLLILGGFILYGQQFVKLWLGETYLLSWKIALFIMIVITIPLSQSFANSILEASKKIKFKAIIALSAITIGMILGAFLAKEYNAMGMIFGILLGRFLSELILNIYYVYAVKLNVLKFLIEVFLKNMLVFVLVLALGFLIDKIPGEGWINFGGKIFAYAITFLSLFYIFAMQKEEKLIVEKLIKIKL
ncbi:O-antigen/teichoic acid export membrane protein [Tenacibaculum sp. 190130A14a]|uniref:O-antigen/teichoic acid export membrane protein n=1 Tax=Tenacibaculum polynesiense TaxID=3137857 RepID=A0ABP1EYK5_9FLAO